VYIFLDLSADGEEDSVGMSAVRSAALHRTRLFLNVCLQIKAIFEIYITDRKATTCILLLLLLLLFNFFILQRSIM